jgi:hypothetical protein
MTIGPLFLLPKEKRELAFADFGKAFEDYVCDILRRMFPDLSEVKNKRISCNIYGKDQNNQEFEIDACLNDISDVVFFETKTGLIREDKILLNNYEEYLNHLREKYVQTSTSNKGIGQLVRSIQALASRICVGENREFENAKEVYPIIVVYDSLLNSPVYGEFFASEFLRLLKPNSIVKNGYCLKGNLIVHLPIVITIDDLENLETSIEHFGFCELLSDYSRTSQDRLVSLNNFIATSHYNQHMFHNRNIANIGLEIIEKSKKAFFPNESDNSI